jgi:hypothetical protein
LKVVRSLVRKILRVQVVVDADVAEDMGATEP